MALERIVATLMLAVTANGCSPREPLPKTDAALVDPPLRALHEIPFAPARPGPFLDERHAFDAALAVYRARGFSEKVELDLSEDVVIPFAGRDAMHTWRFFGDGPTPRAHTDAVSRIFYGGRLASWERAFASPEAATRGLHAFMLAALGHEIAHVISAARGISMYESDPWREETRAIRFEWLVLRELVARGQLPETVLADAVAFNRALLAGAPDGLVAALPKDDATRRARFNAGYHFVALGDVAGHEEDVDTVLALYTLARLELAAAPPETWDTVGPLLDAPPPDPTPMRTAARAFLQRDDLPFEGIDLERLTGFLKGSEARASVAFTPIEPAPKVIAGVGFEVRYRLAAPLTDVSRAALAVLLMRANREHDRVVCDGTEVEPALRCRAFAAGDPADPIDNALLQSVVRVLRFFLRWGEASEAVLTKGADPLTVVPADAPEIP